MLKRNEGWCVCVCVFFFDTSKRTKWYKCGIELWDQRWQQTIEYNWIYFDE